MDRQVRLLPALAVSSTLALAACAAGDDTAAPDEPTATADAPTTTAVSTPAIDGAVPVRLPSDDGLEFDWRIAVAPDGETALVARSLGFFPQTRESTIYEITRQDDGSWGGQVEASFVTDETSDIDPFFRADGSRVWFSSIRAVDGAPRPDVEVWYADRQADGSWGEPVHAAALNSPGDDLFPSIGPDGALYVGSDRGGAGFDVWRAAPGAGGTWEPASPLPAPVTTTSWEFNPVFSPDGTVLVFTAQNRDGGEGSGDIFLSTVDGETWSEPVALASVNTAGDEYHPAFSPDGETFYFVRQGDLYEVPVAATELAG